MTPDDLGGDGDPSGAGEGPGTDEATGSEGNDDVGSAPAAENGAGTTDPSASDGSGGPAAPGEISDTSPGTQANPTVAPAAFECDASLVPASPTWRRLTRVQYENTLRDLLALALGDMGDAMTVFSAVTTELAALPEDERPRIAEDLRGSYRRLDQGVSQFHVDTWYEIGVALGQELVAGDRLPTVVGACVNAGGGSAGCVDQFIQSFGARVLRRPLTPADLDLFRGFYGDASQISAGGFSDVIAGLLNAPEFLYLVEHGQDGGGADVVHELTAHELASRLSYHFWDTMPDDELWALAEDGSLLNDDTYRAQVERLSADARAHSAARRFFGEWLKLENLPRLDEANGTDLYRAFAGTSLPSSTLHLNMMDEVLDLMDHLSWEEGGGIDEFLTTQLIFPRTDDLAQIYGVQSVASPVMAPNDERPGLLTRAAFLSTGSANTRPIKKGVFIRENVLCDHIPPPPAGAADNLPDLADTLTTREVVEALTETEGSSCAGCHAALINPLGYATENFDALGRYRTEERLFDAEGNELGEAPIDTSSVPRVSVGDETESAGAAELMGLIADSSKAEACLVRHYFRYSFGRWEDVVTDGCALEQMRTALANTGSIAQLLEEVALAPSFRARTIVE